jgi:hypothetical protein
MLEPQGAQVEILIGGGEATRLPHQGAPRAFRGLQAVDNVDGPAGTAPRGQTRKRRRVLGRCVLGFHQREIHAGLLENPTVAKESQQSVGRIAPVSLKGGYSQ